MNRVKKRVLLMGTVAGLVLGCGAAEANELYFTMPTNFGGETDTVFVYGAPGITGTVSSPNGFSMPFTIGADKVTSVSLSPSDDLTTDGVITNNGFVVKTDNATDRVGASYLSRETATTDTTYLLDSTALGTSYYAVGYQNTIGYPSQLSIVGTVDGTSVTITPSNAFSGGEAAGTPFSITLNKGQAVLFNSGVDVTGSKIVSSAPIAIFGGNQCTDIPLGAYACDHVLTALPSTDKYTETAVVPTTFGTEGVGSTGDIIRVLAGTDGTVVKYNGSTVATLNAGNYVDFNSVNGGIVTANNPVLVDEYLTSNSTHTGGVLGDPSMSWVPGADQWLNDYIFSTPVGSEAYANNFLDLAIMTSDIASLMLDGSAVPGSDCTVLGGGYSTCEIPIDPGSGEIADTNPFLLLIDGGTDYDSYFTFAGTTFSPGASPPPPPPPPPSGVPEPGTLLLLASGLLGAFGVRRRRKA